MIFLRFRVQIIFKEDIIPHIMILLKTPPLKILKSNIIAFICPMKPEFPDVFSSFSLSIPQIKQKLFSSLSLLFN